MKNGNFEVVENVSLQKHELAQFMYEKIQTNERVSLSARSICWRNTVINLHSLTDMPLIYGHTSLEHLKGASPKSVTQILDSEKLLQIWKNKNDEILLMCKNDPSSRSCNPLGALGLLHARNMINIGSDSFLFQMKEIRQVHKKENNIYVLAPETSSEYWTFIKDGEIVEIPEDLSVVLNENFWTDIIA